MIDKEITDFSNTLKELSMAHEIREHPELKTPPHVCAYHDFKRIPGIKIINKNLNY
jgi:hypothetical protein